MKVAHFIQRYPPALGGSEAYFARLSRHLATAGDRVSVFTSNAIALEAFWSFHGETAPAGIRTEDGVQVRRYALLRWPGRRYWLKLLSFFPSRIWQCLAQPCNPIALGMWHHAGHLPLEFDVVHASAFPYSWPIVCGWRLARRLKVPFFVTPFLHLGDPADPADPVRRAYTRPHLRWLLRQADGIFAQTIGEKNAIVALGVPAERVILQGFGVDAGEVTGGDRLKSRYDWGFANDQVCIGHLANLSREKGSVDLLLAVEELWKRNVPANLILAGPEMDNFRIFWTEFCGRWPDQIAQRVRRLGVLTAEQKKDFFAGIDLFCLPSRSDSFEQHQPEAWANGIANVAYRAGGIADVIRSEVDGLLVPCGNIAALAAALNRMIVYPRERLRFGSAGRDRLAGEFQWPDKLQIVRRAMRME